MIRYIALCMIGALALSGCQSFPAALPPPYAPPVAMTPQRPPAPNLFQTAPRATALYQLFACNPSISNSGDIGPSGEVMVYTPYMLTDAGNLLRNPTEAACLSSGFGTRVGALGGEVGRAHTGIDLARPSGGFVFAAGAGRVAALGWRGTFGIAVELDHGAGVRTLYAHLSEIDPRLAVGSWVPVGAAIARMGATGNATGVHLHYEVSVGPVKVDPLSYNAVAPAL